MLPTIDFFLFHFDRNEPGLFSPGYPCLLAPLSKVFTRSSNPSTRLPTIGPLPCACTSSVDSSIAPPSSMKDFFKKQDIVFRNTHQKLNGSNRYPRIRWCFNKIFSAFNCICPGLLTSPPYAILALLLAIFVDDYRLVIIS